MKKKDNVWVPSQGTGPVSAYMLVLVRHS